MHSVSLKSTSLLKSTVFPVIYLIIQNQITNTYLTKNEEEIFKTKKMLSIIPIEALMKVNNIENLLHLKGVVNSIKCNDIKNAK